MQDLFKKIPVQLPKPISHKGKRQSLLNYIGCYWHMKDINQKLPALTKPKLGKKSQYKEDAIKINPNMKKQS